VFAIARVFEVLVYMTALAIGVMLLILRFLLQLAFLVAVAVWLMIRVAFAGSGQRRVAWLESRQALGRVAEELWFTKS
jgi:hypothetical protein